MLMSCLAYISVGGTAYHVEPDMTEETVVLQWGLFKDEMYVEFNAEKFGPYRPVSWPVPLHRHRAFKHGKADERAGPIRALLPSAVDRGALPGEGSQMPCAFSAAIS
jgi:hypothetical protein